MKDINRWELKYKELSNVWGIEGEYMLKQYKPLVRPGKVLDLGIGEGRNSLMFAITGHEIIGVDISDTALKRSEELFYNIGCKYNLLNRDITSFEIRKEIYTLIIAAWSLNFMDKAEALKVFNKCQEGLNHEGLLYIGVFSKDDPQYKKDKERFKKVGVDSFYLPKQDLVKTYFDKSELVKAVKPCCEILSIKEDVSLDFGHGEEHYHGAIELLIRKKRGK